MPEPRFGERALALLLLVRSRRRTASPIYRALIGASAVIYALAAMIVGSMIQVGPGGAGRAAFFWIIPRGPGMFWSYPAIFAGGPHFFLVLPILSTILTVLTSVGVGLGMATAVCIGVRALRPARGSSAATVTAAAGLTPALIAALTLGACCSTTAAAGAGIVTVARVSGSSTTAVLVNTWYLGLFQIVVVYVALLAQEQLVSAYEQFFGNGEPHAVASPSFSRRAIGLATVRVVLIASGIVWAVSSTTYWFAYPVAYTSGAAWFGILVQHFVPGSLAVLVGLAPREIARWFDRVGSRWGSLARGMARGLAGLAGVTVLVGVPPSALAHRGSPGLFNEIAGALGLPARWGAAPAGGADPLGTALAWVLGFGLLGGTALVIAARPGWVRRAFRTDADPLPFGEVAGNQSAQSPGSVGTLRTESVDPSGSPR